MWNSGFFSFHTLIEKKNSTPKFPSMCVLIPLENKKEKKEILDNNQMYAIIIYCLNAVQCTNCIFTCER